LKPNARKSLPAFTAASVIGDELILRAFVVEHTVDDLNQLLAFRETESFLPQTGAIVANDDYVCVVLFVFYKLAELLQHKLDVLFAAGEKVPTGPRVEFFAESH
jgi:hypothetical protein